MSKLIVRLIEITCDTLDIDDRQVTVSARFAEDLGADSIDCVNLMMMMEEAFGIEFDVEDVPDLTTIAAVARYLRHRAADEPEVRSLIAA